MTPSGAVPTVTVIMPVRDEAPILRSAVSSMLQQELRGFELEVIAVDGRSTDGSRAILDELAASEPRLRVLDNPHQLTPHAMNIGLRAARGEYVCICGAHAVYDDDYIAVCLEELERRGAVGCSGRVRVEPANESLTARLAAWAVASPFASSGNSFRTASEGFVDTIPYPLFRKDALLELGGYNERLARNQDNDMNERLRAAGHRLYLTWRTNCMYRARPGLRQLMRYGYNNGYWNLVTLRENPRAMRPRHFVPMVFVLGTGTLLLLTGVISLLDNGPNTWLPILAVASIVLHLSLGLLASLSRARRERSFAPLLMPFYILGFHTSYGTGMLIALLKRARAPAVERGRDDKPRVIFLTHYFHPEVGASQTRILECARLLHERGHDVTVVTGFPNYPDGVIPAPYRGRWLQAEVIDGFRVLRSRVYPAPNRGFGRRIANHTSFAISSVLTSWRAGRADVVIAESPPLFTAAAAVIVARRRRARLLLNVADLWPESAVQLGALKNRFAIRVAEVIERHAYRHSDLITVPTPGIQRTIAADPTLSGRVKLLPNAVDVDRFDASVSAQPKRVVYCGTVGLAQGLRTLLEAARQLEAEDAGLEFLIVGDGAERLELERLAAEWGLRSVVFKGRVRHEEVPEVISSAAVAVMLLRDVPLFADALPTKLLEYMAAGRPVVAAATGQVADLVRGVGAGIVCPPEDASAVANAIRTLTSDADGARTMGELGRVYVQDTLSRAAMVATLETEIQRLLEQPARRS